MAGSADVRSDRRRFREGAAGVGFSSAESEAESESDSESGAGSDTPPDASLRVSGNCSVRRSCVKMEGQNWVRQNGRSQSCQPEQCRRSMEECENVVEELFGCEKLTVSPL